MNHKKPKEKPTTKRKQVKRACMNCKRAHAKCQNKRPCERCIRHNITATCVDVPRKRSKNANASNSIWISIDPQSPNAHSTTSKNRYEPTTGQKRRLSNPNITFNYTNTIPPQQNKRMKRSHSISVPNASDLQFQFLYNPAPLQNPRPPPANVQPPVDIADTTFLPHTNIHPRRNSMPSQIPTYPPYINLYNSAPTFQSPNPRPPPPILDSRPSPSNLSTPRPSEPDVLNLLTSNIHSPRNPPPSPLSHSHPIYAHPQVPMRRQSLPAVWSGIHQIAQNYTAPQISPPIASTTTHVMPPAMNHTTQVPTHFMPPATNHTMQGIPQNHTMQTTTQNHTTQGTPNGMPSAMNHTTQGTPNVMPPAMNHTMQGTTQNQSTCHASLDTDLYFSPTIAGVYSNQRAAFQGTTMAQFLPPRRKSTDQALILKKLAENSNSASLTRRRHSMSVRHVDIQEWRNIVRDNLRHRNPQLDDGENAALSPSDYVGRRNSRDGTAQTKETEPDETWEDFISFDFTRDPALNEAPPEPLATSTTTLDSTSTDPPTDTLPSSLIDLPDTTSLASNPS